MLAVCREAAEAPGQAERVRQCGTELIGRRTDADLSDSSGDAADYGFGGGGGEAIFGEGPAVPTVLDADATAEGFESLAAASRDAWSAWAGADVDVWA